MISNTATTPRFTAARPDTSTGASIERGTRLPWPTSMRGRGASVDGYVSTFASDQAFAVGLRAWSPPV